LLSSRHKKLFAKIPNEAKTQFQPSEKVRSCSSLGNFALIRRIGSDSPYLNHKLNRTSVFVVSRFVMSPVFTTNDVISRSNPKYQRHLARLQKNFIVQEDEVRCLMMSQNFTPPVGKNSARPRESWQHFLEASLFLCSFVMIIFQAPRRQKAR